MPNLHKQHGVTLLETVLYIGLLSVVLPLVVSFSVGVVQKFDTIDPRTRMEQKAGLIFTQLSYEITSAEAIDVTGSTFGSDGSVFVFQDENLNNVTIDRPQETVTLGETQHQVHRLRLQREGENPVWLTDKDMEVASFNVQVARDSSANLNGLNVHVELERINPDEGTFRGASLADDTTFSLSGHTIEL